jgi:hypothetical protein
MTAKTTVQAADFAKSPRVRPSAALSALMSSQLADPGMATDMNRHPDLPMCARSDGS